MKVEAVAEVLLMEAGSREIEREEDETEDLEEAELEEEARALGEGRAVGLSTRGWPVLWQWVISMSPPTLPGTSRAGGRCL